MGSRSNVDCWEIMGCDKSENCPARRKSAKPCWEIAAEIDDDYRKYFNICRDCIVHVLNTNSSVLSDRQIKKIVEAKTNCRLSRRQTVPKIQSSNVMQLSS